MKNIILIGMPGSGKTTLGKELAVKLSMEFIDTDEEIEKEVGCSVQEIFKIKGESYFRSIEQKILTWLVRKHNCVISTGGGIINCDLREIKRLGFVIYLMANPSVLYKNLQYKRPLINTLSDMKRLLLQRNALYFQCCDFFMDVGKYNKQQCVKILSELFGE